MQSKLISKKQELEYLLKREQRDPQRRHQLLARLPVIELDIARVFGGY